MPPAAYQFAAHHHGKQKRQTGEEYIRHPMAVMQTLDELGLRGKILECALLHDICEDTSVDHKELMKKFGQDVGLMVYFLTKENKARFPRNKDGHQSRLDLYMHKLYHGISVYPELILVKMSDQIDNLGSIDIFPIPKRERIVQEIRQHFFPLYQECHQYLPMPLRRAFGILYKRLKSKVKQIYQTINKQKNQKLSFSCSFKKIIRSLFSRQAYAMSHTVALLVCILK